MPADRVVRVHVKHTLRTCSWAKAEYGVGNVAIHVPPGAEHLKATADAPAQYFQFIDYPETARTLLFHHPDLINVDTTVTNTIKNYMLNDPTISDLIETLAGTMRDMGLQASIRKIRRSTTRCRPKMCKRRLGWR